MTLSLCKELMYSKCEWKGYVPSSLNDRSFNDWIVHWQTMSVQFPFCYRFISILFRFVSFCYHSVVVPFCSASTVELATSHQLSLIHSPPCMTSVVQVCFHAEANPAIALLLYSTGANSAIVFEPCEYYYSQGSKNRILQQKHLSCTRACVYKFLNEFKVTGDLHRCSGSRQPWKITVEVKSILEEQM